MQVDLLAHERVVETIEGLVGAGLAPPGELVARWQVSRGRVQRDFGMVGKVAGQCAAFRSLYGARKVVDGLECCSSWTSLRTADPETAGVLVAELGITREVGAA